MSVSIKDIAKRAGVSHSTVSRALSDSPLVSAETKARINLLAREMGYSPDAQARSLVMGRTMTIGVVFTSLTDPFIAQVVQGIEETANRYGYSVILAGSGSEPEREMAAVQMLRSKRVDGVIVTSSRVGALYQRHLERLGVPVVLVNSHSEQSGRYTFSISVDNEHGAWLATRHLLDLGHRRVAYVAGAAEHSDDLLRRAGYRRALEGIGLPVEDRLVLPGTGDASGGERALPILLGAREPATAAFCYNDMTAIGLLAAARRAGVSVPRDLSIVGFDDIPFARYVHPTLTTVAQPMARMGEQAMQMVLNLTQPTLERRDDRGALHRGDRGTSQRSLGKLRHPGECDEREAGPAPSTDDPHADHEAPRRAPHTPRSRGGSGILADPSEEGDAAAQSGLRGSPSGQVPAPGGHRPRIAPGLHDVVVRGRLVVRESSGAGVPGAAEVVTNEPTYVEVCQ